MAKELKIRITGDSSGLKRATDDGVSIIGSFGSKISAWSVASGQLIADGIKTGLGVIGGFIGDSIGGASDLNETLSKVGVLFGGAAGKVEEFAAASATQFGQSKQEALDAAATFATFGKGAGLAGDDLAKFSTDFVGLASDMASFGNTSTEQAIEAIGAALRGEAEPIRAYGVLLDDATLRQKALELGIVSTTKDALTPQQKVLAAQAAIFDQTKDAQGDFARTSGGLANQQRILGAQFENLKTTIGQAFLPLVLDVVKIFNTKVIPLFQKWGPIISKEIVGSIKALISGFKFFEDGATTSGIAGFFEQVGIYAGQFVAWVQKIIGLFQTGGWKAVVGELGSKVKDVLVSTGQWLHETGLPIIGNALLALGKKFGAWVVDVAIPYLQANLPIWLSALGDWLTGTALPWLGDKAAELGLKLGGWVLDGIRFMAENLPGWLAAFATWYVTEAVPYVLGVAADFAVKLEGWIDQAIAHLKENLPGWLGAFTEWVVGTALPEIVAKAHEFAVKMAEWVVDAAAYLARNLPIWVGKFEVWAATEALPAVLRFGRDVLVKLGEAVAGIGDFLFDIGVQLIAGLIRGVASMGGELRSFMTGFIASNIPGPVRGVLGISSPSKVFHKIGVQTAQGLAGGMMAGSGLVSNAAGRLAGAAFADIPGGRYSAAELAGGQQAAGWQQTKIMAVVSIDGREVVVATENPRTVYERSRR